MRVLRSQYLQLGQKLNETNDIASNIGTKVLPFDETNNNEFITLTQTSTVTTTTTKIRRNSLILSNQEVNCVLAAPNDVPNIADTFGFAGFPETEVKQTAVRVKRRRNTLATFSQKSHSMQIQFCNVPDTVRKINVTVEFVNMGPLWLTRIYQSYENDLWQKRQRISDCSNSRHSRSRKKWYYDCLLCFKQYCAYRSLKSHLNYHLDLYPYNCKLCARQYTNRSAVTKHLRSIHHVERDDWNEFIA